MVPKPGIESMVEGIGIWIGNTLDSLLGWLLGDFFKGDYTLPGMEWLLGDRIIPEEGFEKEELDAAVLRGQATFRPWLVRHIENIADAVKSVWDFAWQAISVGVALALLPGLLIIDAITPGDGKGLFGDRSAGPNKMGELVAASLPVISEDTWGFIPKPGIESMVEGIGIWIGNTLDSLLGWLLGDFFKGDYTLPGMEWLLGDRIIPEEGFEKEELDAAVLRGQATFRPWLVRHIENIADAVKSVWDFAWQAISVGVALALLPGLLIIDAITPGDGKGLFGDRSAGPNKMGELVAASLPVISEDTWGFIPKPGIESMVEGIGIWIGNTLDSLLGWLLGDFFKGDYTLPGMEWLLGDRIIPEEGFEKEELDAAVLRGQATFRPWLVRHIENIADAVKSVWDFAWQAISVGVVLALLPGLLIIDAITPGDGKGLFGDRSAGPNKMGELVAASLPVISEDTWGFIPKPGHREHGGGHRHLDRQHAG